MKINKKKKSSNFMSISLKFKKDKPHSKKYKTTLDLYLIAAITLLTSSYSEEKE